MERGNEADDAAYREYQSFGNEECTQAVPHVPVPLHIQHGVRIDYAVVDGAALYKNAMLLLGLYCHVTRGSPLPPILNPEQFKQDPEADLFDF